MMCHFMIRGGSIQGRLKNSMLSSFYFLKMFDEVVKKPRGVEEYQVFHPCFFLPRSQELL